LIDARVERGRLAAERGIGEEVIVESDRDVDGGRLEVDVTEEEGGHPAVLRRAVEDGSDRALRSDCDGEERDGKKRPPHSTSL
jgi:hypothetical protein